MLLSCVSLTQNPLDNLFTNKCQSSSPYLLHCGSVEVAVVTAKIRTIENTKAWFLSCGVAAEAAHGDHVEFSLAPLSGNKYSATHCTKPSYVCVLNFCCHYCCTTSALQPPCCCTTCLEWHLYSNTKSNLQQQLNKCCSVGVCSDVNWTITNTLVYKIHTMSGPDHYNSEYYHP